MSKRKLLLFLIGVLSCLFVSFLSAESNNNYTGPKAKYVFLFIGDGMALPQINSTEIYLGAIANKDKKEISKLDFTQFASRGLTTTYDAGSFITDSASAGTAIATGNKTLSGVVNMDVGKTKKFTAITEMAKKSGMKIGIVTSVSIDHATPAVFYAHQPARSNYYDIGVELTQSGFDYFGGGGFLQTTGPKKDKKSLIEIAKEAGYSFISNKEDFLKLKSGSKILAINPVLQDESSMEYEIDRNKDTISLSDFTKKGIEILDNPRGFFMMVEGGKIDWSGHANDAASTINDVIAFNSAVKEAIAFAGKHPKDTLIVVTGDHETGGMTIGFAGTKYDTFFDKLKNQKISFVKFNDILKKAKESNPELKFENVLPLITENFGLTLDQSKKDLYLNDYEIKTLKDAFAETMKDKKNRIDNDESYIAYGGYEPLTVTITHILNKKAGIGWTSYSHTGVPVVTYASGVGRTLFDGYYDNTDIFFKLKNVIGLK
jgi:alkaline phosphatase